MTLLEKRLFFSFCIISVRWFVLQIRAYVCQRETASQRSSDSLHAVPHHVQISSLHFSICRICCELYDRGNRSVLPFLIWIFFCKQKRKCDKLCLQKNVAYVKVTKWSTEIFQLCCSLPLNASLVAKNTESCKSTPCEVTGGTNSSPQKDSSMQNKYL